jgi:putative NADPH-quinone reductase
MPRRVAIIHGHPDPGGKRLCHALADAYAQSAVSAGHEVTRIEVARLDFPVLRTQEDFEHVNCPKPCWGWSMLRATRSGRVGSPG